MALTQAIYHPLATAITITAFVAAALLLVEYIHVRGRGAGFTGMFSSGWKQYLLAAFLGATPGCLGVFTVVSLYSHGHLRLGALVAAAVASCGDEAFVMLAMFPGRALAVFAMLATWGLVVGAVAAVLAPQPQSALHTECMQIHTADYSSTPAWPEVIAHWRDCSPTRGAFTLLFGMFLAGTASGLVAGGEPLWIRWTLALSATFALLIVASASDHFLEEHLWKHVIRRHLPGVFLWTLGSLVAMQILAPALDLEALLHQNQWMLLGIACVVGLLPESGPHLIFVTLYAEQLIPTSVLLASSVVQDGHGLLPLLAFSRGEFIRVKLINLAAGLGLGAALMAMGM